MSALVYTFILPALLMGLMGGAHCIGMCGGIVCAFSASCQRQQHPSYIFQLFYSMGRITTYTMLGAASGLAGMIMAQRMGSNGAIILRSTSAIFVILTGLYVSGWWRLISSLEKLGQYFWQPLSKLTRHLLPVANFKQAFLLGSLWGLLPCGMVYSALIFSLSTQQWQVSALMMLAFGLGTLPALLLVGTVMQSYQHLLTNKWVRTLSGLTLIALGLLAFWLAIPHHGCAHCAH